MHRRRFLASAAALSSVALAAGCTGTSPGATTSATTTADETTSTATAGETPAVQPVVADAWVGRSFRYLYAGAHVNAYTVTGDGPVFAFALAAKGAEPALELDGETHAPASELPGGVAADAAFFDSDTSDRRVLAYSLPGAVDAADGAVADHGLNAGQLAFLGDPAEFAVTDVSVPDSVGQGSDVTVTVTAENSGGTPGTFRAAATSESISAFDVRQVEIPPGERGSVEVTLPVSSEQEERVNYTWGSGGGDRTVSVER